MREIISNLYKIKWGEKESKYKKEKMMKCNEEVKSSGGGKEAKREVKCWREYNHRCGLIWRRKGFCCCLFIYLFLRVARRKV